MESGDPDAPAHSQKRLRLDLGNPAPVLYHNGLPHPQPTGPPPPGPPTGPPPGPPSRRPPHHHHQHSGSTLVAAPIPTPSPAQASPPPPAGFPHYPPHTLPPPGPSPSASYSPRTAPFSGPSLSPSFDIRVDPRPRPPPPNQLTDHGTVFPAVSLPARSYPQEQTAIHPPPPGPPHPTTAPESGKAQSAAPPPPTSMEPNGGPHSGPVYLSGPDPRQNGNIPNGYQVVSPHSEQFQPPPMTPTQHFPQHVPTQFVSAGNQYINSPAQYPSQAQIRRKQVRATQACNNCRQRKQKCDENRPCQFCREQNLECQYKDVPPPKQDRTMLALQDSVHTVQDLLKNFIEGFNTWKDSVESRLPPYPAASDVTYGRPSPTMASEHDQRVRGSIAESDLSASRRSTPHPGTMGPRRMDSIKSEPGPVFQPPSPFVKRESILPAQAVLLDPSTPAESERRAHSQKTDDETSKNSRLGLLGDHTTPAHQLLEDWSSMKEFYSGTPLEILSPVSSYALNLEQKRGLLRMWGLGEGIDRNDGAQGPASPESMVDAPSPAKEGPWGTCGGGYATPPMDESSPGTPGSDHSKDHPGGLNPDGSLKLDAETVKRLMNSYFEHIHILHPFLDKSRLQRNVHKFIELYSPDSRGFYSSPSAIPEYVRGTGLKRKRSTGQYDGHSPSDHLNPRNIERSIGNAIILLVLALGKVCEHKGPLPGPTGDQPSYLTNPYIPEGSRVLFKEASPGERKNIDTLPGLAYFAHATDILGNQVGGNSIAHAQAFLLAGLYHGQYARVLESWSHITTACRACIVLIRNDLEKLSKKTTLATLQEMREGRAHLSKEEIDEAYRLNLLKCAYWTCLQLESDILAEMSTLPPSGISAFQDEIGYPSGVCEEMPSTESLPEELTTNMLFYSAQIHLRVLLNNAQNSLYKEKLDTKALKEVNATAKELNENLMTWRGMLPEQLQWDDRDAPATDINAARLRAKYYGGRYMILRPFLFLCVHESAWPFPPTAATSAYSSQHNSPAATTDYAGRQDINTINRDMVTLDLEQMRTLQICRDCIECAIQSTIAFDRVGAQPGGHYNMYEDTAPRRLIVTNIFGTLHAQFGNMLVLSAVYRSTFSRRLSIRYDTIEKLLKRTIRVLTDMVPNSPTLHTDLIILDRISVLLQQRTHRPGHVQ